MLNMGKVPVLGALIASTLLVSSLCAAQNGKVETTGPLTETSVPEAVRQALDSKGYRVLLDDGTPVCELWVRKSIPAQPKTEAADLVYPEFAESTLAGVLHFPRPGSDYRGQAIAAGFYTLRYELMPSDGNHLGAAPSRDFVLLVPAGSDPSPNATFKFQELVALSRTAAKTKHPGVLSLVQPQGSGTAPTVSKDNQDHWIFSAGIKLSSGEELPFALVVKGTAQQ
ncbi:MAG TPA: hypothetical protein VJX16_18810 [Terriglobales bacterium]|nr:hypothetical protein [Terriglobales bacterium]